MAAEPRSAVLIFASGVGLGAVIASLSVAALSASRPEQRAPAAPEVVCKVEPCAACPACPDPVAAMPPVREPPSPDGPPSSVQPDNGESVSERSCERARTHPMQVSDAKLAACGRQKMLGTCEIRGNCPTCACSEYAWVEQLCDSAGKCGGPLNGTGCVAEAYYGSRNPFFNCTGTEEEVAGCMMRKLAKAGLCTKK